MSEHDEPVEVHEDEERAPGLDPETRARRDRALALIRKYGDPILRTRAVEVDVFDEALAAEVERMGVLMHESIGIGLAATQVGLAHRVLVYRVEPNAAIAGL